MEPFTLTVADGAAWVASFEDDTVVRVDLQTRQVVAVLSGVHKPSGVVALDGNVWVVNHRRDQISRIDSQTNRVVASVSLGDRGPSPVCGLCAQNIAAGEGGVWTANATGNTVSRIDPYSDRLTATVPLRGAPFGIAAGEGALWVTLVEQAPLRELARIDPSTNEVLSIIALPGADRTGPIGVAAGEGGVWVTYLRGDTVYRIDPTL